MFCGLVDAFGKQIPTNLETNFARPLVITACQIPGVLGFKNRNLCMNDSKSETGVPST